MNRTELFNKILQHLYDDPNHYHNLIPTCKENFGIKNGRMIESIGDELIERGWATSKKQDKYSLNIHYNGQQVYEKYGSYSSFLRDLKKSETKVQVQKRTDRALNNIGKISAIFFGLTSFILGYNKFFIDDIKIDSQQMEIKQLNEKLDSLRIAKEEYRIISEILNYSYGHETDEENGLSWIDLSKPYSSLLVLNHTSLIESDVQSLKDYLTFNNLADFSIEDFRTYKEWDVEKIEDFKRYKLEVKTTQSVSSPFIGMIQISSISYNEEFNEAIVYTSFLCAGCGDC
jgi:hypothetical protein